MVISRKPLNFIASLLFAIMPFTGVAQADATVVGENVEQVQVETHAEAQTVATAEPTAVENVELDKKGTRRKAIKEFINHHVMDSHDFTLFSDNKEHKYYGFSLPVILKDDNGFHFFMSGAFHHGDEIVTSKGSNFFMDHHTGRIYNVDVTNTADLKMDDHQHVDFASYSRPMDFSITKSVVGMLMAAVLMFFIFTALAKSYAKNNGIPTGGARIFEPLVTYIRDEIAIPNIGHNYKKYMPYLLTIFFFVLFLNLMGLTPLGFNVTGQIAVTAALALLTFLITNFTANKHYWGHIFWMPGVPKPMRIILAPIELLGVFIKPFSLMIRLYANIFAGHLVVMSIIGLMFIFQHIVGSPLSFGLAFALMLLEILVAFLQAYIFTMLSALYFGGANAEHHDDH